MVARQKIDSRYIQDTSKERRRYVLGTSKIRGSNSNVPKEFIIEAIRRVYAGYM